MISSGYDSVLGTSEMNCTKVIAGKYITYYLQPTYAGSTGTDGTARFYLGVTLDETHLIAGNSYTFSMHILSPAEIRTRTSFTWSDSQFASHIGSGFSIGFGIRDYNGDVNVVSSFISITKDNYLSLAGTNFVSSFECPDYSGGNPCIVIIASNAYSTSTMFFDDSMTLVDNDEEDEEGFFSRLFEWFQDRFNDLSSWFDGLGDRISGFFDNLGNIITDGINNVLEGIGGWFQKLGNLILYLEWTDTPPENPFKMEDGPLASVRDFFDDIVDYLSDIEDDFASICDSITGPMYLLDKFTERFEWLFGILVFTLLMIVISRFIGL